MSKSKKTDEINGYLKREFSRVKNGLTRVLDFYHLKLEYLPSELFELEYLEELNLKKTQLKKLPKSIAKLKNLKKLVLEENDLLSLPEEIGQLQNLTHLSLKGNNISALPVGISNLGSLKTLNLADNFLEKLPSNFEKLLNLEELQVQGNNFNSIPNEVYHLNNLKHFYFVEDTKHNISSKASSPNSAQEISKEICGLDKIEIFNVDARKFLFPPPEIVSRGIVDIKKFFLQIEAEGEDYLFEAKLLIVGEPGAGKTTLSRKIIDINCSLPADFETTKGIEIGKFDFLTDKQNTFLVNIWDFGGQEIYHSTHQFFLTKRSLYILVCDTRKEDTSYQYWLQVIELLSDSSPVLLVHNEKQDRSRDINFGALRKRFLKLRDQIQRSNFATNRGLEDILDTIKYEIQRLPHVGDKLPKTWIRVRRKIEEIATQNNYISDEQFYEICEFNGISEYDKAKQLSNYLHDLGVFLHFKDGSILERTIILNNSWATEAVYKVLDDSKIKDDLKGKFDFNDLSEIWNEKEYKKKKEELLALMLKFELCYKVENSNLYIAPQLLPIDEPNYEWDVENSLQFRFVYEFMPKGIIARLIVRLHKFIFNNRLVWREGVIIEQGPEKALIKESYNNKEIQIFVTGNQPRIFLTIIVEEIDRINASFSSLSCKKFVPCNCKVCRNSPTPHFYEYSDLLRRIENQKSIIECPISYDEVNVRRLIEYTFESEVEKRKRLRRKIQKPSRDKNKVFISYSHKDSDWLKDLSRHFDSLKSKIEFWDDSKIIAGDKWKMQIENSINEAKVAILILSADFFNSEFIKNNELPQILERAENEGTVILGIILKPCLVEEYPKISQYQFINKTTESIIQMNEAQKEQTWMDLVKEVKRHI